MNLQNQIRQKLVDGIINGAFAPGMKLPSSQQAGDTSRCCAQYRARGRIAIEDFGRCRNALVRLGIHV
jgi:hypothetical protein